MASKLSAVLSDVSEATRAGAEVVLRPPKAVRNSIAELRKHVNRVAA
jgi:hypothetical protein